MNNLKGYSINHPDIDSLSSEWFVFTHKNKLYQVSISIDNFHNSSEYDLRVFSYSKYRPDDNILLNNVQSKLHRHGIINSIYYSQGVLKEVFANLNSMLVRKEKLENIELGPYLKAALNNDAEKANLSKNVADIYYELVLGKIK